MINFVIISAELWWMTIEQASRGEEIHLRGCPFIVIIQIKINSQIPYLKILLFLTILQS